jgi:uncharacterized protein (TIGR00290 family)
MTPSSPRSPADIDIRCQSTAFRTRVGVTGAAPDALSWLEVAALAGRRFFCSWSGGKDAYLALHGLPLALLEAQAAALGIPLVIRATTWEDYEATFVSALHELRKEGVEAGVFGDIDLEGHRIWVEGVCEVAGMSCHLPLWREPRRKLVGEMLSAGVVATIVVVDASRLSADFLGRELDDDLIARLEEEGVDVCGEEGEYHTVVTAAPLFTATVPLGWNGHEERAGHWVLRFAADRP